MSRSIIFITGMSGTGKSTILDKLSEKGYKTIDTDYNQFSIKVYNHEQLDYEWIWDTERIKKEIDEHTEGILFISGTVSNQGKFYSKFDEVIFLSAPLDLILQRVQERTTNNYGKSNTDRREIINNFQQFEAIIAASSTVSIDEIGR